MLFLTAEALTLCVLGKMSPESKKVWKDSYRVAKKYGIRAGFARVFGTGFISLVKVVAKTGIKRHAKWYLGMILVNTGLTCFSGRILLLTNATKIIKYSKACHSVCAASWRAAHNVAELLFIIIIFCKG